MNTLHPQNHMQPKTNRLLRLIDQLLEFRKMQSTISWHFRWKRLDVVALIYEIFILEMVESKNMDFQFVPSVSSYTTFVDKGKLDKMVYNLLSNGI